MLAAAVDNGDSIPKEGEATYGACQPISLQAGGLYPPPVIPAESSGIRRNKIWQAVLPN